MGSQIEKLEHTWEMESQPPFEDGIPEALLEKLDEAGLWSATDEFAEDAAPLFLESEEPDEGTDIQMKCHGYHTVTQRKCWGAGYPGEDGFKYL